MSEPVPLWRFRVEADRLDDGHYSVRLTTDTGRTFIRTGYSPLWELIRIIGSAKKAKKCCGGSQ